LRNTGSGLRWQVTRNRSDKHANLLRVEDPRCMQFDSGEQRCRMTATKALVSLFTGGLSRQNRFRWPASLI
jgi:hypothetical protein